MPGDRGKQRVCVSCGQSDYMTLRDSFTFPQALLHVFICVCKCTCVCKYVCMLVQIRGQSWVCSSSRAIHFDF